MSTAQSVITGVSTLLLSLLLIGLFARGRARYCFSFTVYVGVVMLTDTLVLLQPDRFFNWSFYLVKEAVLNLLKLAVTIELAVRAFQAFPAAGQKVRGALVVVLVVTAVAVWMAPTGEVATSGGRDARAADLVLSLQPRITNGTAWLFGAIFVLILYYRVPLHPMHKAIAAGFMAYLLLFTVALDVIRRAEPGLAGTMRYAHILAYTLLEIYWVRAAWRQDDRPGVDPGVVSRLQPWIQNAP